MNGKELLGYIEARKQIYIPTYQWVLENKVKDIIDRLREVSKTKTIVLLDYDTNADFDSSSKHGIQNDKYLAISWPGQICRRGLPLSTQ